MDNQELQSTVSKILVETKYQFPTKTERRDGREVVTDAVYMVDIPKASELIANHMQSEAERLAIGFAEWLSQHIALSCESDRPWMYNDTEYTTSQLYQLYFKSK